MMSRTDYADQKHWSRFVGSICCHSSINISLALFALFFAASPIASPLRGQDNKSSDIKFSGDFRLRYENTTNLAPASLEDRNREVVRFRAGVTKEVNELLKFGVRLATGSSNDPNTADITLGSFVNDLEVSLDRAYVELKYEDLFITGGKFGNPFRTTDLVWDGDVNPQGAALSYTFSGSEQITPKVSGIYSVIDEHSGTLIPDSWMWGGQTEFSIHASPDWNLTLAGAFYDYKIRSLSNADAGDTRSNYLVSDSTGKALGYVSDFDLLDAIAIIEYRGLGERYPIRFSGDYVKNLGANVSEDKGFMLDLYVGRASKKDDLRFQYGYSQTETDAVLAAFSNDNTTIATNYIQHTLAIDYVVLGSTTLNLTWYLYKNKLQIGPESDDFLSRLRLNAVVKF
jgi:hypothetical protein